MIYQINKLHSWGSSQDGGIGRNPSLPCTTKRRITTNLKSINNQKHQKIKLHGTPTTKEVKEKSTRTTRPVRWTTRADSEKPCEGTEGRGWLHSSELHGRDWLKGKTETWSWLWATAGVAPVGDTSSLARESVGKFTRDEQASRTVPSLALPPQSALKVLLAAKRVALPSWVPKPPPLTT